MGRRCNKRVIGIARYEKPYIFNLPEDLLQWMIQFHQRGSKNVKVVFKTPAMNCRIELRRRQNRK